MNFAICTEHTDFIESKQSEGNITGIESDLHPVPVPDIISGKNKWQSEKSQVVVCSQNSYGAGKCLFVGNSVIQLA